jgi:glucokinase
MRAGLGPAVPPDPGARHRADARTTAAPDLGIGIDVGATKIVLGIVDQGGQVLRRAAIDPWQHPALEDNLANLMDTLDRLLAPYDQERFFDIGVGIPGTVDPSSGVVSYTPNLRWFDLPLGAILAERTGRRVHVIQDTGAAVWGEYLFGAGAGLRNVVCATIGSGLACGIVIDGRLYGGASNTAGEIGHLHVAGSSLVCGCGRRGCVEAGGSGLGLVKVFRRAVADGAVSPVAALPLARQDARAIFKAAKAGDAVCLGAIETMVGYLALGLSAVATVLAPDALILSGGLSRERELLVEPLIERIKAISYHTVCENVQIVPARLGADAPLVGAAFLHRAPEFAGGPASGPAQWSGLARRAAGRWLG